MRSREIKGSYVVNQEYRLCEQALAIDPNNVLALTVSGIKLSMQASLGVSGDPKGDMKRAFELESKALAIDPDYAVAHVVKGNILQSEGRTEEAVAEHERALAIDPSLADAVANLGVDYLYLGQPDKSIEYFDKAIRMSLHDPALLYWYGLKAWANFGLKKYDQATDWARRAIAINPNYIPYTHVILVAALALTDHDAEISRGAAALPCAAFQRAARDDRGVESPLQVRGLRKARRSTLLRDQRADVRRLAQGGDAGAVSGRDSG